MDFRVAVTAQQPGKLLAVVTTKAGQDFMLFMLLT